MARGKLKWFKPELVDLDDPAADGAITCTPFGSAADSACMPHGIVAGGCTTGVDGRGP